MEKRTKSGKKKKTENNFFTIGDVSEKTGVKPYILRYWEKEFPFLQPIKNRVGHRLYTKRDVYIIHNIKKLLYERGYSIAGAKKVLWNLLLGKNKNNRGKYLREIKNDLYEMLDVINKGLTS